VIVINFIILPNHAVTKQTGPNHRRRVCSDCIAQSIDVCDSAFIGAENTTSFCYQYNWYDRNNLYTGAKSHVYLRANNTNE